MQHKNSLCIGICRARCHFMYLNEMKYGYLKGCKSFEYPSIYSLLFDIQGRLSMQIGTFAVHIRGLEVFLYTQTFKYITENIKLILTQSRTINVQLPHLHSRVDRWNKTDFSNPIVMQLLISLIYC